MKNFYYKTRKYILLILMIFIYMIFFENKPVFHKLTFLVFCYFLLLHLLTPRFSKFFRINQKTADTYYLGKAVLKSQMLFLKYPPQKAYITLKDDVLKNAIPKFIKKNNKNDKLIIETHLFAEKLLNRFNRELNPKHINQIKINTTEISRKNNRFNLPVISAQATNFFKTFIAKKEEDKINIDSLLKRKWYKITITKI